jgi:hypothetical protein
MARELIIKNEIINENWMCTVGENADGRISCSPAAYRREAPIGSCVRKKWLGLFFLFANIPLKRNLNAMEKGRFATMCHILLENENIWFYLRRTKILPTESNVRPNRDDRDHVLVIMIGVDLGSEQTIRDRSIKWRDRKLHKIRSVASRSRCVLMILEKLIIYQLESNSLYSILHICKTKPLRNGRWAP